MLRIKIITIFTFLFLAVFATFNSNSASAETDVFEEIAKYKTWTKVSKEPIKVEIDLNLDGG